MSSNKICLIEGCDKPALSRWYCSAHYRKVWRYGNALWKKPKKVRQPCRIEGCSRLARGDVTELCSAHYQRMYRFGDPKSGRATMNGAPQLFYANTVLPFDKDECLFWPFATVSGYGNIVINGKRRLVHRLVCEVENGPPPTSKHHAAHLCGKGHLGCVSRKHLSWKTAKENAADTIIHGTRSQGERNGHAKLSYDDVRAIRDLVKHKTLREVASVFGVDPSTVCAIKNGRRWKNL